MRTWFVALVLALLPSAADGNSRANDALIAFADAFDRAQIEQDQQALEQMVSDDLVFIDGTGKRLDKKAFIAGWIDPDTRYDPVILTDRTITRLGTDAAIVGAATKLTGVSGGKRFASQFRFADTFRKRNGRWHAVHIQVTRIP